MAIQNWSENIVVVQLSNDPAFTDDLNAVNDLVIARTELDVVLNFAGVGYVNSSNIAKLLRLRKSLISNGRRMKLCSLTTQVWGVFLMTGLDKVFEFTDDVTTALAYLQLARGGGGGDEPE